MAEIFQFKAVKPAKLKVGRVRLELLNALRKEGTTCRQDYEKCVETWEHKPKFASIVSLAGGDASVLTAVSDTPELVAIFTYVDNGTKRGYRIPKAGYAKLAFRRYNAKTRPGVVGSGSGGAYGPYLHATHVWHPGMEGRLFSATIQKQRKRRFQAAIVQAIKDGLAKSGK